MRMSLDVKEKRDLQSQTGAPNSLRRVRSDTDLTLTRLPPFRSRWSPAVVEEVEELGFSGGGAGNGRKSGGGNGREGKGDANQEGDRKIGNYYQDMLKADPANPLLLRNYGRFLHEVEGDLDRAEEYYGRAILESPNDGDLLSLYGRLVWESQRDCKRAEGYYKRAVEASPDDCYVMGSYAHFLWDAEDEEDGEERSKVASSSPFVESF